MNRSYHFDGIKCYWIESEGPELQVFTELSSCVPLCVCDLETTGLDPIKHQISVIGIGFQKESGAFSAFLFDQLKRDWSSLLRPLLEKKSIYKIFHNAKFDWKFLFQQMQIDAGPLLDTFQAARILDNGLKHIQQGFSLADLSKRYLGQEMDKDQELRTSFNGGPYSEKQLRYVASDLVVTSRLWNRLCEDLDPQLEEIVALEGLVIPPTGSMELNGFRIDPNGLDQLERHLQDELKRTESLLPLIALENQHPSLFEENTQKEEGRRLMANSPKQIKDYVRKRWKIQLKGTDEKTLLSCKHKETKELFDVIIYFRQLQKKQSTYINRFRDLDLDGRLRGNFDALGTSTGRFSSRRPNLQNIPRAKEYRRLFVPEPGSSMIVCDYSQIELRVAAELTDDHMMIQAFKSGQDLHSLTASRMFDKPIEQVNSEERQHAKAVNFGLIYNMQPKRLVQEGISSDMKQARDFVNTFFNLYSAFPTFHKQLLRFTLEQIKEGPVDFRTPHSGRRRWLNREDLYWPQGGIRPNVVYNTPVQGLAGDGLKQALGLLWTKLKSTSGRLLASVHDELVLEAPKAEAHEICKITEEAMINGMQTYLKKVPVKVESAVGESWAEKA